MHVEGYRDVNMHVSCHTYFFLWTPMATAVSFPSSNFIRQDESLPHRAWSAIYYYYNSSQLIDLTFVLKSKSEVELPSLADFIFRLPSTFLHIFQNDDDDDAGPNQGRQW